MAPVNQRQGFLVSAILHLTILMLLVEHPPSARVFPLNDEVSPEKAARVFLPRREQLRQMAPRPVVPVPPPPTPAPLEPGKKDRISIGPPLDQRSKGPLILRKEDDLTAVPKGDPSPGPTTPPAQPQVAQDARVPGAPGLRLPPGLLGEFTREREGNEGSEARDPSISASLRKLDQRLARDARLGLSTGTGQHMGPLFFDPQGADFTLWVQRFKDEVYRNWIIPTPAQWGARGHVDFEFTVERDGTMSSLRLIKSSGTPALDKAAQNALEGSRFLPLPSDFGPSRVTMQVGFYYNEAPQGS